MAMIGYRVSHLDQPLKNRDGRHFSNEIMGDFHLPLGDLEFNDKNGRLLAKMGGLTGRYQRL